MRFSNAHYTGWSRIAVVISDSVTWCLQTSLALANFFLFIQSTALSALSDICVLRLQKRRANWHLTFCFLLRINKTWPCRVVIFKKNLVSFWWVNRMAGINLARIYCVRQWRIAKICVHHYYRPCAMSSYSSTSQSISESIHSLKEGNLGIRGWGHLRSTKTQN